MPDMQTPQWLKIGQVARSLGIAVGTIRMYEEEGLLLVDRTPTGQRRFNEFDVERIKCIRRLIKEVGLNMEGIRRLLALLPCWEIHHCSDNERNQCRFVMNPAKPCWMIKAGACSQNAPIDCRDCPVYTSAADCNTLKKILYPNLYPSTQDASTDRNTC